MKPRPPGLLRAADNPDVVMMIGTAGHVDHGKTRLVRLLTGCNTDRLKVEQERGLTIELGFAPCVLGGDLCVGIVDVPGHEKFVKNMVAGVSGIDMAVLVVAADDGIMPQTVEHVQIMDLLGVRHGLVALTKTDLVPDERVAVVRDAIRAFLEGTFLAGAPICPVSSETGDGIFDFYEALVREAKGLAKQRRRGVFRMPIERSFVQKGFGTVMTGIPVAGTVTLGAQVEVAPGGQTGRIRGIQRFLRDANEAGYGQCLALNVPELSKSPPRRGQVVCVPGYLQAATIFHVRVTTVAGLDPPLRHAEAVKFHTGTSEEPGKLYLLEHKVLGDNETGLATVVAANPVAAAMHDRFILRRPSPARTVGGGAILAVTHGARRPQKRALVDELTRAAAATDGLDPASPAFQDATLAHTLRTVRPTGATVEDMARDALLAVSDVHESVARLCAAGRLVDLSGDWYVHRASYDVCFDTVARRIRRATEDQGALSLPLRELEKGLAWPPPLWRRIRADLAREGRVTIRGDKLLLDAAVDDLSEADRGLMERIEQAYEETGFRSPRPADLPGELGASAAATDRLLDHLCDGGRLVRLNKNVVLSSDALRRAQDMVVASIKEKGSLDSADFKHHIESSRKYALAILDYLDTRKVTVRVGNDRKLAPNYERNLL